MIAGPAFERITYQLGARKIENRGPGALMAQCPAHVDGRPSLSVKGIEGKALVYCFAGCSTADVMRALDLSMADLLDDPSGESYDYGDRSVFRSYRADGSKAFRQSGDTASWTLYRRVAVEQTAKIGGTVYLVEGEKDVHAAEAIGLTATTGPGGAGAIGKVDLTPLKGSQVVLVPDLDEAGLRWLQELLSGPLASLAASVEVVRAAAGKDMADHVAAGHDAAALVLDQPMTEAFAAVRESWQPPVGSWARLWTPEEIQAVADSLPKGGLNVPGGPGPLVAPGSLTLLTGKGGSGKTSLALRMACEVTEGRVLFVAEDAGSMVLAKRLSELPAADRARISVSRPQDGALRDPHWASLLEMDWGAIVLDAFSGLLIMDGLDENTVDVKDWVKRVLRPMGERAAVIMIDHPRKGSSGEREPMEPMGSVQKINAVDYALYLGRDETPGFGTLTITKDNLSGAWQRGDRVAVTWDRGLDGTIRATYAMRENDEGAESGDEAHARAMAEKDLRNLGHMLLKVREDVGEQPWPKAYWLRGLQIDKPIGREPRARLLALGIERQAIIEIGQSLYRLP